MPDLGKGNIGISIHALLAESDAPIAQSCPPAGISIHALLAESDPRACPASSPRRYFYPRSPCGERLTYVFVITPTPWISIHALLAESDPLLWPVTPRQRSFLSTLSLRRATIPLTVADLGKRFLSTLSLRRATTGPCTDL